MHIGVTGEEALAHPTQDTVHKAQDIPIFHGWDNQIPTEVTLDLSLEHKGRFDMVKTENSKFSIDGYHESGLQVGNFRTAAILGAQFRGGYNLPIEYSGPRISLNSYTQRPNIEGAETTGKFSAYLLSGFRGSAVAHDISLDGPIFNDEFHTEVEREVLVAEAYLGFGLRWRRVELSYAHTWRSREFDKQDNWQDFGSVSLRYSF